MEEINGYIPKYDDLVKAAANEPAPDYIPKYDDLIAQSPASAPPRDNYLPNTEALRKGFSGDPLAAFEPRERARISGILNTFDNPDEEAKKHVMAQYLAPRVGMPPESVFDNFQVVADIYFNQKNVGVNDAYKRIAAVVNPQPWGGSGLNDTLKQTGGKLEPKAVNPNFHWAGPEDVKPASGIGTTLIADLTTPANDKNFGGQLGNHVAVGAANLATGAAAYPNVLARQTVDVINGYTWNAFATWALDKPEWQLWYDDGFGKSDYNPLKGMYDAAGQLQRDINKSIYLEPVEGDLLKNIGDKNFANVGKIIAYGIAENTPQFASYFITKNTALLPAKLQGLSDAKKMEVMGDALLAAMYASTTGSKSLQLNDQRREGTDLLHALTNDQGATALQDINAQTTGVFEAFSEKLGVWPLVKKTLLNNPGIKKTLTGEALEAARDTIMSGMGEAFSQLGENFTDKTTGLGDQPWYQGVLESFAIGMILDGSPAGINLFRAVRNMPNMSYHEYDQLEAQVKNNVIEPRKAELLAKPNLTDDEVAELRRLENMTVPDVLGETLTQAVDPEAPAGKTIQQMQTEGLRDFMRSRPDASSRFVHDPAETMNAVTEQAQAFPGVNIVAVDNEASLPPEIKAQIEQQTAAGRVRGLFNAPSDTVYIMSDKVAPADVPLVLLHETVGHLGLRRAFGQQLDPLLDGIFRDYSKDIIAGNESGRWGFNLTDDLTGENDLAGQQRQAAEEFIANTAERIQSGEVRPMWWKGLIVRFKQALRNVPGFKNLRFTDREIEGVLFLSAKAAGRSAAPGGASNDIRFMAAAYRRKGAPVSAEQKNQLRDGNVPSAPGFMEANGFGGNKLYADYEFLRGKHPEYFDSPEAARAATEFVLDAPESAGDVSGNKAFVRADESTGKFYRVEINPVENVKSNHIRSVHELTQAQYEKAKSDQSPAILPSQNSTLNVKRGRTVSDFVRNNIQPDSGNVKTSLAALPGSDIEALGKILLPGVADGSIKSDVDAGEYLKKQGITSLELHEIQFAYGEARYQLKQIEARRLKFEYKNWLASQHPILSGIEERLGVNKIKVDKKFGKQKDFAGAYVDYKNGMPSDEAAKILGVDESDLVEAVRGVKKNDLKAQFKTWKAESSPDAYYAKLAEADRAREVEGMIDDVLAGQLKLSDELRAKYPEVADAVYQRITGNEGKAPADFDWLAAAAQLQAPPAPAAQSDQSDPAAGSGGFMAGFAAGRQQAAQEYQDLIAAVKANQDDITASQKLLKEYAFKHLPKGERDLALKKITQLSEVSNNPTAKYPKGQRHALLEEIFNQINKQRENLMRSNLLERILKRLKQTTVKRGRNSIPISTYDDAQKVLNRIKEISELSPGGVYRQIAEYKEAAETALAQHGDDSAETLELDMLHMFGVLENKTSEQLKTALNEIQRLAHDGRTNFINKIAALREERAVEQQQAITDLSGGKGLMWKDDAERAADKFAAKRIIGGLEQEWKRQNNFTWLMNNITRLSGKNLADTIFGKLVYYQHIAENKVKTGKTKRLNAWNAEFDRIFGTHGVFQTAFGAKRSRGKKLNELQKPVEQSGVFKYQRPPDGDKGIDYSNKMTPDEARAMLNEHKEGKAHLQDYEVECLQHQLDDIAAGEKYITSQYQTLEDEMMRKIADENKSKTPMVVLPRIKDMGKLTEQRLSQTKALTLWLNWQQPNVQYKMRFNGWTNEGIQQLESFLQPEMRKMGEWMVKDLAADHPNINEVFRTQWHTELPSSKNYFPTSYTPNKANSKTEILGLSFGVASVTPGALKSRRFHLMEPQAEDAFKVWGSHINEMEPFKALSENNRKMNVLFNNADVKAALIQYHGDVAAARVKEIMVTLANGGRADAAVNKIIGGMFSRWASLKLIYNIQSAGKQLAGSTAYLNNVPAVPFIKGVADFWTAPAENAKRLMNTDYFKNRFSGGSDRDVSMLLDASASIAGKKAGWMQELVEVGSLPNRIGDALSIVIVGHASYKYHYDMLINQGVDPAEAERLAIIKWEIDTDLTQQSSSVMDMNHYQLGDVVQRMLTMFMSNPILAMQQQTETTLDLLAGRQTSASAAKLTRMIMVNHVIIPALMWSIVQFRKHGFDWDEYEGQDLLAQMFLGPFEAFYLLGKGLSPLIYFALGENQKAASVIPMGDEIIHAWQFGEKLFDSNKDLTTDDILKGVEVFGSALSTFFPAGTVTGAAGREGRRWWNFFTGDGDKKQKKHTLTGITP